MIYVGNSGIKKFVTLFSFVALNRITTIFHYR